MLRKLKLLSVYDSAEQDLVRDLQIPLLLNCNDYLRGVGFFTSGWLRIAAQGIVGLVENGGRARFIVSPILEEGDWKAFQLGHKAKIDEVLKKTLSKSVNDIQKSLQSDTRNTLAWMVADGILDFKFAVVRDKASFGDYHDKVGVFTDEMGDRVAIHGSFNDTFKGTLNGEAFSVFKSWANGQDHYVRMHLKRLLGLWNNINNQFAVYGIPETVREKFIRLRESKSPPYQHGEVNKWTLGAESTNKSQVIHLRPYQEEAIKTWEKAGCKGVFEMATGTGKTITSLAAAQKRNSILGRIALIIEVPYIHLLHQWKNNCKEFGFSPILCSGDHDNWHLDVKSKIGDFNLGVLQSICILVVHQTAATKRFMNSLTKLHPEKVMLIGDEIHRLGAPKLQGAMISKAQMRLGLSATPHRWFDEEGTASIFSFFGDTCFEYPLEKAIGRFLVPYEYQPILVNLSESELYEYERLTSKISNLAKIPEKDDRAESDLKYLLLKRAQIITSATEKITHLLRQIRILTENAKCEGSELGHILVYCAPGSHKNILKLLSQQGLRCHEFVHDVSAVDRQKVLKQFGSGEIQVLVAIKCLDEGVDIPSTQIAFLLASTTNPREFVQRRGRVLRLAPGKEKAIIYDFIVVPSKKMIPLNRDIEAGMLKREMPRFAEFAGASLNEFQARSLVRDILDKYGLLCLMDEKPWEIYREIRKQIE